jgi:hypothetical protein
MLNDLIEITFQNQDDFPEWKKNLWIELIQKNSKEMWPYEKIIKNYINLRNANDNLHKDNKRLRDLGIKNDELEYMLISLRNENTVLKQENESLKNENDEKNKLYNKIKGENSVMVNSLLRAKEIESELHNKIFELELQIKNKK